MITAPTKIKFVSDSNIAIMVRKADNVKTNDIYVYRFIKSVTKLDKEFPVSMGQLKKLVDCKLLEL